MSNTYLIRSGFTIVKNGLLYVEGQSVDLSDLEFELHKHKLEGVSGSVFPSVVVFSDLGLRDNEGINTETLAIDKYLQNSDLKIQDLTNSTDNQLNLFLPTNPLKGKGFLIINQSESVGNFYSNNTIIYPGDRYEIVFNGDRWIET